MPDKPLRPVGWCECGRWISHPTDTLCKKCREIAEREWTPEEDNDAREAWRDHRFGTGNWR